MSEDPTPYGDTADIERELQRHAVTLRQIADCVEHMPLGQLGDLMHLIAPTEELFAVARRMFNRPFGE
jgi:hypothetical protein